MPSGHLKAAVVGRRLVDCKHHGDVIVGELVGGRILMGRKAGPSWLFEVDLLFVEKCLLAKQSADRVDQRP